jgi:hypothetical protein
VATLQLLSEERTPKHEQCPTRSLYPSRYRKASAVGDANPRFKQEVTKHIWFWSHPAIAAELS